MYLTLVLCMLVAADPPPERRDTVVVTGVYDPVPLEEADRSLTLVGASPLPLFSGALVDLLQFDSSVDLRRRAPGGVQADLSIRGGTFGQSLVLVDGLRLNDPQTGHHNLDLPLPLEAVSRVEILKGAGSTLYGSDAVGGAVNFITRPPEASSVRLRSALGSFGVNQQRVTLSAVRGRWAQQLTAARDFSSGFIPNRDYRDLSLASTTHITTALGSTAVLLGHRDHAFGADNFYGDFRSWERTRTWFASLRQELGPDTQAAFGYRRHTDLFILHRDRPEVLTNRHAVESYQVALRRRHELSANTRLHYGAEVLGDSIRSTNLGSHSRTTGAGYAALDFRALGRFSLSAGLREQIYAGRRSVLSPSLSGGVWLSSRLKLRASAGRAFRLPSFTDLYYQDPATRGSPLLRPERAWSLDAGLDWNPRSRLRGELTVFQRRETDGIDYVRYSAADIWRAANIGRLRFTGLEAAVAARIGPSHRIELRYTALGGARAALGSLLSRYVFNYPTHSGVGSWQASFPGKLLARARLAAIQRYGRYPYAVVDLSVARGGRFRPFLHLTNLTGAHYEEILGVPMPGRGVVVGLEWVLWGPPD